MGDLKYKVGDKVLIKSLDWYNENKDKSGYVHCGDKVFDNYMSIFCGSVVNIGWVYPYNGYAIREDIHCRTWTDEMIECKVEEEMPLDKAGQITDFEYEGLTYTLPEGYQFVDANGNVINATKKIVLKKLEKKKKEYPKTFLGCCDVLEIEDTISRGVKGYKSNLLDTFQKLLICRDAYWKIAGENMGLNKPWEPDYKKDRYIICKWVDEILTGYRASGFGERFILEFPTEEMRDAFFNAFRDDIEKCKEFI